jgi:hypothetical protein
LLPVTEHRSSFATTGVFSFASGALAHPAMIAQEVAVISARNNFIKLE